MIGRAAAGGGSLFGTRVAVSPRFAVGNEVTVFRGDCRDLLASMPDGCADLVVTSPPYNVGKSYELRLDLDTYVAQQAEVIASCVRVLSATGSLCWQVGNHVDDGAIVPLDAVLWPVFVRLGLRMRNRIVWHYPHGLHCKRRFSGRYEVIAWFTKSDGYWFDVDPVRVPQKYPGKRHFKGPRAGEFSCNPLGKNPGDLWEFPNVKSNHVEKTIHPCQFPVELAERLVLSMSPPGGLVLDPFLGVGSTAVAAVLHGRRAAGAELVPEYAALAEERVRLASEGGLRTRPMDRPAYRERPDAAILRNPFTAPSGG